MQRILIVEDEHAIRGLLAFLLRPAGYEVLEADSALTAIDSVSGQRPDLVLLDRMLPDMDGLKVLKIWRTEASTSRLPVILVSARATEADRVEGLQAGADDYITKPFSRDELLARVQSLLRRTGNGSGGVPELREIGGLALDVRSLRVTVDQQPLPLGPIEFRLLNMFMSQPGRALSRQQILRQVWRANAYVDQRTVDVHIRRLRAALEPTGHHRLVQTVRGVGYRFADPHSARGARPSPSRSDSPEETPVRTS